MEAHRRRRRRPSRPLAGLKHGRLQWRRRRHSTPTWQPGVVLYLWPDHSWAEGRQGGIVTHCCRRGRTAGFMFSLDVVRNGRASSSPSPPSRFGPGRDYVALAT